MAGRIVSRAAYAADAKRMRSIVRNVLAVALLGALFAVSAGFPQAGASEAARTTQRPTLFGLDVPSLGQLDASESTIGARAAIVGTFADWAHTADFPRQFAEQVNAHGAVLLISWEPWDSWRGGPDQPAYALRRIVAGEYDGLIDRWAGEIARYRRPVMLRLAPEMNGDWLPWSTGVNSNRPGDYVAAWRHVRARFRRAGAANAIWVWNPVISSAGSTPLDQMFPGSNQVDWLAVDGYNWGSIRRWGWQSYADIFPPTLRAFHTLAPGRPVMIAETATAPGPGRPAWVTDTMDSAHADGIAALVWFEFDKETDWRLASDPATAEAARAVLDRPGWRQGGNLTAVERLLRRPT